MKMSELQRLLKSHGCTFEQGTKHTKVSLGTKSTRMPRHPSKEIKKGTLNAILKDLGIKEIKE
jgi:mRNA interferase HicA